MSLLEVNSNDELWFIAVFSSVEQFFDLQEESYAGVLPLWLAADQVRLWPVTEESQEVWNNMTLEAKRENWRSQL